MEAEALQKDLCLAVTYGFEGYIADAFAASICKPQRCARRRRGSERGAEAHGLDACMELAFQRFQAAEEAQAALDFGEHRPRRLERDLRRELAGPGADRLERALRQERE